jgi:hypothetical protein
MQSPTSHVIVRGRKGKHKSLYRGGREGRNGIQPVAQTPRPRVAVDLSRPKSVCGEPVAGDRRQRASSGKRIIGKARSAARTFP